MTGIAIWLALALPSLLALLWLEHHGLRRATWREVFAYVRARRDFPTATAHPQRCEVFDWQYRCICDQGHRGNHRFWMDSGDTYERAR